MHRVSEETRRALEARRNGHSLVELALSLGKPASYNAMLSKVLRNMGGVSLEAENELRLLLGLPAIGVVPVPACPSCGEAHVADDCGGKDVQQVVVLGHDETVRRKREPKQPERWADYPPEELAAILKNRRPMPDARVYSGDDGTAMPCLIQQRHRLR